MADCLAAWLVLDEIGLTYHVQATAWAVVALCTPLHGCVWLFDVEAHGTSVCNLLFLCQGNMVSMLLLHAFLQVLRLARNRLQSLPEALGAFSALQVLDCSGNRLTSVPRVVGRCTSLQQLLMSSNRLRGLTSGIGNLVRLQLLDLSHNQYRHLPTMTGDLTQLQVGCEVDVGGGVAALVASAYTMQRCRLSVPVC